MTAVPADRARSTPRSGWTVVAAKEFGDHLLSIRFAVLVIILSIAAAVPLYFLSGLIRQAAEGATDIIASAVRTRLRHRPAHTSGKNFTRLPRASPEPVRLCRRRAGATRNVRRADRASP